MVQGLPERANLRKASCFLLMYVIVGFFDKDNELTVDLDKTLGFLKSLLFLFSHLIPTCDQFAQEGCPFRQASALALPLVQE